MEAKRAVAARPEAGEYAPYYETYISKVKGNNILAILEAQRLQMAQLFAARSERDGNFRYAPGKWTVKEVLGHMSDTERIFTYRALRIARVMHVGVVALLSWLAYGFGLPWPAWAGIAVVAALLAYEHSLVRADDLSKLNAAFFTVNGYISMLFLLFWGAAAAFWRV